MVPSYTGIIFSLPCVTVLLHGLRIDSVDSNPRQKLTLTFIIDRTDEKLGLAVSETIKVCLGETGRWRSRD